MQLQCLPSMITLLFLQNVAVRVCGRGVHRVSMSRGHFDES